MDRLEAEPSKEGTATPSTESWAGSSKDKGPVLPMLDKSGLFVAKFVAS